MLNELWHTIRGRAAAPPLPVHFTIRLAEIDEHDLVAELIDAPSYEPEPISGFSCILVYRDSAGDESERRVTCQRIDRAGDHLYLFAWCHERQARRQFRIDRILSLVDLHSGEIMDDVPDFIARFRIDREQESGLTWGLPPRRRADLIAALNVLVFIGRCDKEWHPLEREALRAFVSSYWLRAENEGDPPIEDIAAHADRLSPDAETFYVALDRCTRQPAIAPILRRHVRALIDADGRFTSEEFYWGREVDEAFNAKG